MDVSCFGRCCAGFVYTHLPRLYALFAEPVTSRDVFLHRTEKRIRTSQISVQLSSRGRSHWEGGLFSPSTASGFMSGFSRWIFQGDSLTCLLSPEHSRHQSRSHPSQMIKKPCRSQVQHRSPAPSWPYMSSSPSMPPSPSTRSEGGGSTRTGGSGRPPSPTRRLINLNMPLTMCVLRNQGHASKARKEGPE